MSHVILAQEGFVRQALAEFVQRFPVTAQRANGRVEKAFDLALSGYVSHNGSPHSFEVRSQSRPDEIYLVDSDAATCECADSKRFPVCKHRIAAYIADRAEFLEWVAAQERAAVLDEEDPLDAHAEHGTWGYVKGKLAHKCADGFLNTLDIRSYGDSAFCARCEVSFCAACFEEVGL